MEVSILTTHGIWSETGFPNGMTIVFGYEDVQLLEVRNQSNCSRSGSICMLLEVKEHPLIGNSMRLWQRMKSLNVFMSLMLPPGLLRLSGARIKLKSHTKRQSSIEGILSEHNHWMNCSLCSPWQGPYTLTNVQHCADWVDLKRVTSAKSSDRSTLAEKIVLFQMVTIPPKSPREGTNANWSKRRGQQDLMKVWSKEGFLVSHKQITAQPHELIAFESANCFASEFKPRTLQHRTFQLTWSTIIKIG